MTKKIKDLSPQEVLALAISVERSNRQALDNYAHMFDGYDTEVAQRFRVLAEEESKHEQLLRKKAQELFGGNLPSVDGFDVQEVVEALDMDDSEHLIFDSLKARKVYELALQAEKKAQDFYREAGRHTTNKALATLFAELGGMEDDHAGWLQAQLNKEKNSEDKHA